jgi:hypothetical protein
LPAKPVTFWHDVNLTPVIGNEKTAKAAILLRNDSLLRGIKMRYDLTVIKRDAEQKNCC